MWAQHATSGKQQGIPSNECRHRQLDRQAVKTTTTFSLDLLAVIQVRHGTTFYRKNETADRTRKLMLLAHRQQKQKWQSALDGEHDMVAVEQNCWPSLWQSVPAQRFSRGCSCPSHRLKLCDSQSGKCPVEVCSDESMAS